MNHYSFKWFAMVLCK